jgi:hypothetical protein
MSSAPHCMNSRKSRSRSPYSKGAASGYWAFTLGRQRATAAVVSANPGGAASLAASVLEQCWVVLPPDCHWSLISQQALSATASHTFFAVRCTGPLRSSMHCCVCHLGRSRCDQPRPMSTAYHPLPQDLERCLKGVKLPCLPHEAASDGGPHKVLGGTLEGGLQQGRRRTHA